MIELHVTAEAIRKTIPLSDDVTVFGRSLKSSNVALDWDRMVSSRHFQIEVNGTSCLLTDLGSTNGTKVNGSETRSSPLTDGDVIQVGTTLLRVVITEPSLAAAVVERGPSSPFSTSDSLATGDSLAASGGAKQAWGDDVEDLETERRPHESQAVAGQDERVQQVCLRVTSQWDHGRVFWFGAGNQLIVGRSSRADCSFPSDQFMSSEHCRVSCTTSGCLVEDLHSRGGTWLNGEVVKAANLFDGDQLRAGNTLFAVEVLADSGARMTPPATRIPLPSDTAQKFKPAAQVDAQQASLSNDLFAVRGPISEVLTAVKLVPILANFGHVHFIIDFSRTGLPVPDEIDISKSTLFPWLGADAAKRLPIVLHLDEWSDWSAGVEEAWGSDALEIVSGDLEKDALIEGLREVSRKTGAVEGIVGLCWPGVLRPLLASEGAGLPSRLFGLVAAVACEGADAGQWEIFCKSQELAKLEQLGIAMHQVSQDAAPDEAHELKT